MVIITEEASPPRKHRQNTNQQQQQKVSSNSKKSSSRDRNGRQQHTAIQITDTGGGGNGNNSRTRAAQRRPKFIKVKVEKPRQEICAFLKWTCFIINVAIFLISVACLALGLYLFVNDPRAVAEPADFLLNPAVLLACVGLVSGVVALFGLFGALRDNVFLLKLFALCVFLAYLALVVGTCLLFLLFYSDATGEAKGISAQSVLLHSIGRYHANKNVADFVDYLQEQLECCGSTSFRDWHLSEQFNCNASNPYPERCGVPFSCCRRSVVSGAGSAGQNPQSPPIRSIRCWQNAQNKREQELDSEIYVAGCLQPLRSLFDSHAIHIGIAVVSVILPVCLGVCLSQCLARQIDYQHFLLRREQRRLERRERRDRRYREECESKRKKASISSQSELINETANVNTNPMPPMPGEQPPALPRRPPPKVPPPPTPRNDAEAAALAAAIRASKQEWAKEQSRRVQSRAASFSPMRRVALRKEAEKPNNGGGAKRKSMTLDLAVGGGGSGSKMNKEHQKREKKQTKRNSQQINNIPTPAAVKNASSSNSRPPKGPQPYKPTGVEPSAPPIFLTLQQHHFN